MGNLLASIIDNFIFILFFEVLFLGSIIRQGKKTVKKRNAFLIIIGMSLLLWLALSVIQKNGWNPYFSLAVLGVEILAGFLLRKWVWPFKRRCVKCGKDLTITQILSIDENKCDDCFLEDHPGFRPKPNRVGKRDKFWDTWRYDYLFSTVIIMNDKGQMLLIDKTAKAKGSGKICGATAFCKAGEDTLEACHRAAFEETGLRIYNPRHMGYLSLALPSGNLRGHVYLATEHEGQIRGAEGSRPFWQGRKGIPFKQMSVDCKVWLPHLLNGTEFDYYAIGNEAGQVQKDQLYIDTDPEYLDYESGEPTSDD